MEYVPSLLSCTTVLTGLHGDKSSKKPRTVPSRLQPPTVLGYKLYTIKFNLKQMLLLLVLDINFTTEGKQHKMLL